MFSFLIFPENIKLTTMDNENVIIKLNIKFPGLKVIGNWNEGPAESVIDFIKR